MSVILDRAVGGETPLTLHLRSRGGKITQAWATTPDDNTAHALDVTGLRVSGDRISGSVTATVGRVQYALAAEVKLFDLSLAGTYRGRYGITSATGIAGRVSGEVAPRAIARQKSGPNAGAVDFKSPHAE